MIKKTNLDSNKLPKHVAFIIDGNGRWAKKRGLSRLIGHTYGFKNLQNMLETTFDMGIKTVSIYGFSTENWSRPKEEVDHLMDIIRDFLKNDSEKIYKMGVKLNIMGDITRFPKDLQDTIIKFTNETKNNDKRILNLGINYGGRDEIIRAVNNVLKSGKKNITKEEFSDFLYTAGQPDPDFIIRTSGEQRLSNFMPWQSTYSELYFPKILWPDFNEKALKKAIKVYQKRNRRFGGT